ncbi:MAG TPA: Nramp family divalent metal transporter [Bryobacteraceae bacterium]|nr:Nramp family divalent metal transporter [Bryobacteraceae bacterium]
MIHSEGRSLSEINSSVPTAMPGTWKRLAAFAGPAYLVSIGYMDPGNWATDLEGGSRFGYQLLWVLVVSNFMAILLQTLSARLGIVTRQDLAQACRAAYPRPVTLVLWALCEVAIAATDLAEVLGAAIALHLLFGIPLLWAVLLTAIDSFFILYLLKLGVQKFEWIVRGLVAAIGLCFAVELFLAKPEWGAVAAGLIPSISGESLYVAIGILGATVMPHNLYLHSSLVQTRQFGHTLEEKKRACRFNFIDSAVALNAALLVNAAILILAAAVFYRQGVAVTEIEQAHQMLSPLLGTAAASALFAISLLLSGQASTLTGTLSGQIVMEGFLNLRLNPWVRRLVTRGLAIVPAVAVIYTSGESQVYQLLILSQVVLSLQLPFAVIPLIRLTSDKQRMGEFANRPWVTVLAGLVAGIILFLNAWLVKNTFDTMLSNGTNVYLIAVPCILLCLLLLYLLVEPFVRQTPAEASAGIAMPVPEWRGTDSELPVYRKILVPLDHSASDAIALRHAMSLARQSGARLLLLHVEEGATSQVYGVDSSTAEVTGGSTYFQSLSKHIAEQHITCDFFIRHSTSPSQEIVRLVKAEAPDLIVMAAHGHGRIGDLVYGQTIEHVRHAVKIPLLVVQ